ncbi:hypothetical protein F4677DRAFT_378081 [Hypoxylon crocopeplum]|nr:hypothetical protein F4677DRAFT_378081 [Hypoxylon crocopeplum]
MLDCPEINPREPMTSYSLPGFHGTEENELPSQYDNTVMDEGFLSGIENSVPLIPISSCASESSPLLSHPVPSSEYLNQTWHILTCPTEQKCDLTILHLLEEIINWRKHDYLLETLSAVRGVLRQLETLTQCSQCPLTSTSTMMLLILAEKLVDQFSSLIVNSKALTSQCDGKGGLGFGEYYIEAGDEQSVVYLVLARQNVYLFRMILTRIADRAKERDWLNHLETVELLMGRSGGLDSNVKEHLDASFGRSMP